jgi:3-hydroxyacyl-[acyl-carrier-protein] dehydratase
MPGVLQIEALAQAAGILAIETLELAGSGKLVYFMSIEEAKFRALWNRACCSTSGRLYPEARARVQVLGQGRDRGKVTAR